MRKLFKLFIILLLFMCVKVYAESIPTVTLQGVYSDEGDPIELVDGVYKNTPEDFKATFNVSFVNNDYCIVYHKHEYNFLREIYDEGSANIYCDYSTFVTHNFWLDNPGKIEVGFVKKSDYEELEAEHENDNWDRSETDLQKYNTIEFYVGNFFEESSEESLEFKLVNIKDSGGSTKKMTIDDYYLLDKNEKYYFTYQPSKDFDDTNLKINITASQDGNEEEVGYYRSLANYSVSNGKYVFEVDMNEVLQVVNPGYITITFYSDGTNDYYDSHWYDIRFKKGSNEPQATVKFNYKNSDKEIIFNSEDPSLMKLEGYYFDENNPLVLNVEPKNYDSNVEVTINVRAYDHYDGENDEEIYVTLYHDSKTVPNDQTTSIDIPYFFDEKHDSPNMTITVGEEEFYYDPYISYGSLVFAKYDNNPAVPDYGTWGGKGDYNFSWNTFPANSAFLDKLFFAHKVSGLLDDENYTVKIIQKYSNNVLFSKVIKGSDLKNNYLYVPINYEPGGYELAVYRENDFLITGVSNTFDFQKEAKFNLLTDIISDNIVIDSSGIFPIYYLKEGTNSFGVYFKGVGYDNDKTYKYYIKVGSKIVKDNITGKDINDGKTINITFNSKEFDYDWINFQAGICGEDYFDYSNQVKYVSAEEFNSIKNNRAFNFTQEQITNINNRNTNDEVLFIDSNGNDVTKDITYSVEYYKDGELDNTANVTQTIGYFEEEALIDTTKIQLSGKYDGYKVGSTSFGEYNPKEEFNHTIANGGTLKIYYVQDEVNYRVEYYYDNKIDDTLTVSSTATIGTQIEEYEDKVKTGYKLDKVVGLPLTVSVNEETNVIKVYYRVDETQTKDVSYRIEYYKDNELDTYEDVSTKIQILKNIIEVDKTKVNITNKYTGYVFDKLNYDNIPDTIENNGVIKVYYIKGSYNYKIEYYYNNKIDESASVTGKSLYGSKISEYPEKAKTGYKFDKVVNIPLTVTENEETNVIKLYYAINENQTKAVSYRVEYYKDGELADYEDFYKRVQILKETFEVDKTKINITNKYPGYKYDHMNYDNIPDTIEDNGVIKVYYVKDEFNYRIEYYYNDEINGDLTVSGKALYGNVIEEYKPQLRNGYTLDKVEGLPLTISETGNNNVIRIYYVTDQNNNEQVNIKNLKISKNNNKVTLTWDKDEFATGYKVLRADSANGTFITIYDSKSVITSYTDTKTTYGKKYYYKVKAYNKHNYDMSDVVSIKVVPNTPKAKIVSAGTNNIKLSWDKVSVNGYQIYTSTDNKKWTKLTTITKNSTLTYNNTKLKTNKTYYYKVRAYKTVGSKKVYSPFSEIISTKTAPVKPTLKLTLKDLESMNLTIGASKGATKYIVQKSLDGKTYETIENVTEPRVLTQADLEIGKTYYYRVRACNNQDRCSGWVKAELKQTTKTPGFSIKTSRKKVTITMSKVNGATGYQIYRATSKKGKYSKIKEFSSEVELLEYVNKTKKGKTYYYKVRSFALNELGNRVYSPYSKVKSIRSK